MKSCRHCAGGEWYFDSRERQLYYVSDETDGRPPADGELEAVVAESLVVVRGSKAAPVRNFKLANISLQDTAATFLTPHENPSGGDWGLVHTAAVVAHGTEGVTVDGCRISRVDGQGILFDGYTRAAAVLRSELDKIGSHAIVTCKSHAHRQRLTNTVHKMHRNGRAGRGQDVAVLERKLQPNAATRRLRSRWKGRGAAHRHSHRGQHHQRTRRVRETRDDDFLLAVGADDGAG